MKPYRYQIRNDACYIPKVKKIYIEKEYLCWLNWMCEHYWMCLACKWAFHGPEHNAKGGGPHGTDFWKSWIGKMKYTNR